jgi:hypothetical protein
VLRRFSELWTKRCNYSPTAYVRASLQVKT